MEINIDDGGALLCPLCRFDYTHVDTVQVSARAEDDSPNEIIVHAITGKLETHCSDPAPVGEMVKEGRRQRISIRGWCEGCGGTFAIVFTQHKGATLVEAVRINAPDAYDVVH